MKQITQTFLEGERSTLINRGVNKLITEIGKKLSKLSAN